MSHDWDGRCYDVISGPIERNGVAVLDRLDLRGDERVLDAGCGSGRVTSALADRLPNGRVIGVDASPAMIEAARSRLGDRAELIIADLATLDLGGRLVDAVFSNAVFHWLPDHQTLFAQLLGILRPGGRLVAQCGGQGNTPELVDATLAVGTDPRFAPFLEDWCPWCFAGPRETARRLRLSGFTDVRTWLIERPAPFTDLRAWLRTNALSAHLLRLPEALRDTYLETVARELGSDGTVTYIRLEIDARAPTSARPKGTVHAF